jgi:MFS family permease
MKTVVRNILAIIIGWFIGSFVNMGLIDTGHTLIPIEGLDPNDMKALAKVMPTLSAKYFIFPFLAHALGTLVGAIVAGWIAASHKMKFSLVIGALFLLGGIAVSFILPAPIWFIACDIILAYIPMAFIGGKIAKKISFKSENE